MMHPIDKKIKKVLNEFTDQEKIRLFYELAKDISGACKDEVVEPWMEELLDDIANVIADIENL